MKDTGKKISEALTALGDLTTPAANKVRAKLEAALRIIAEAEAATAVKPPTTK